jgi:hypothetical protein
MSTSLHLPVIQGERLVVLGVMVSTIMTKKVHIKMCQILNIYGDIDIEINELQVLNISILNFKNKGAQITAKLVMCQHYQFTSFLKFYLQPQCTLQLASECRMFFV